MSNRVKVLCKDYEVRIAKAKTEADKAQRKQEMISELQAMGLVVTGGKGGGLGQTRKGPSVGSESPGKKQRSTSPTPALGGLDDQDEGSDAGEVAITSINHKEAYLSLGTIEKIAAKHDVVVEWGQDKDKNSPMSLSEAADQIIESKGFSRRKWLDQRQKIFGLAASSAGSRLKDNALVSSVLSGYLGKFAQKL
jgi:hypothetical protein